MGLLSQKMSGLITIFAVKILIKQRIPQFQTQMLCPAHSAARYGFARVSHSPGFGGFSWENSEVSGGHH